MRPSRLDAALPAYDFREVHRTTAPPGALAAVKEAGPGEMPLVRTLFAFRSLPALVARGRGLPTARGRPLVEQLVEFGFVPLADEDNELVLGYVGQPWRLAGGSMPRLRSAEEWEAFAEPGYVKAAMNFLVADGELSTETRIKATDEASRRRFGRYWRVIRPASGSIRRSWLCAAKRRVAPK
jgi:hypothetical protein